MVLGGCACCSPTFCRSFGAAGLDYSFFPVPLSKGKVIAFEITCGCCTLGNARVELYGFALSVLSPVLRLVTCNPASLPFATHWRSAFMFVWLCHGTHGSTKAIHSCNDSFEISLQVHLAIGVIHVAAAVLSDAKEDIALFSTCEKARLKFRLWRWKLWAWPRTGGGCS